MRRPSLTKKTAEALDLGVARLRMSLAVEADEGAREKLIRAIDYLNHSVEYRRWLDRTGSKG